MTKTEIELASKAQACGVFLVHEPGKPYFVRTLDGGMIGPMTAQLARTWLAGYSFGMYAHAPNCQCGRVACVYRNAPTPLEASK